MKLFAFPHFSFFFGSWIATQCTQLITFLQVSLFSPKSPEARHLSRRRSSVITWDPSSQVYMNTGLPPEDQFDQYLYQSHHVGSPSLKCTPELILETPSDTESGTGSNFHKKSNSRTPPPTVLPHRSPSKSPRPPLSPRQQLSPRPPLSRPGRRPHMLGNISP